MKVCGVEIKKGEVVLCILQLDAGLFELPPCRVRSFPIKDAQGQEFLREFQFSFAKLMEDYGYPGLAEHREEHQAMIDTVEDYVKIYNEQGHDSLKQVTNLLTFWLINHIKESDKQYRDYLQELGADEFDNN